MGGHVFPAVHHAVDAAIGMRAWWWLQAALATAAMLGPGWRFHRIGWPALTRGAPEMNSLVAIGTTAAWTYSLVGDGFNDAPAPDLAAADVGMAVGSGTDIAIENAELVLMRGDLWGVATAVALSRATIRNIRQNLGWVFGYNAVLIPVAALDLLSPMLAAGAMGLSSLCVVGNALRLRRAGAVS